MREHGVLGRTQETLNLQVQVNTRDGQYDFNSVTVYHISNIGLPEQTETTLGSMNPLCLAFPPAQNPMTSLNQIFPEF